MILGMKQVVLVPGRAMRANEFDPLIALLKERGLEARAFDNLCVGQGRRPTEPLTIQSLAENQWAEIDAVMTSQSAPIALFGLSMGGMIAATMTTLRPNQVSVLIVAATSPNEAPDTVAIPDKLAQSWLSAKNESDLRASFSVAFGLTTQRERPDVVARYCDDRLSGSNLQNRKDFLQQMQAIQNFDGPATYASCNSLGILSLVVSGEEDQLFNEAHTNRIHALLGGNKFAMKSVGHMLHLENATGLADSIVNALSAAFK
jgi:pimeloyl-ACP methyl ester carboxylesterase